VSGRRGLLGGVSDDSQDPGSGIGLRLAASVGVGVADGIVRVVRERADRVCLRGGGCHQPLGLVGDDGSYVGGFVPGKPANDPWRAADSQPEGNGVPPNALLGMRGE
jgi:hypothetical protein